MQSISSNSNKRTTSRMHGISIVWALVPVPFTPVFLSDSRALVQPSAALLLRVDIWLAWHALIHSVCLQA